METTRVGHLLVADAGAGVALRQGVTYIPLVGVSDVSAFDYVSLWATKGITGPPGEDTGQALYRVRGRSPQLIADLFAFEKENNPDGADLIDSNPFDVESLGRHYALVADAGGNDLLRVDDQGNIEVLAVFPNELVPTANIKDLMSQSGLPKGFRRRVHVYHRPPIRR